MKEKAINQHQEAMEIETTQQGKLQLQEQHEMGVVIIKRIEEAAPIGNSDS